VLSALPISAGGKNNRDPKKDVVLMPGDVVTLDLCPNELFLLLEMDALMLTSAHR
jgi:hypothetical protein